MNSFLSVKVSFSGWEEGNVPPKQKLLNSWSLIVSSYDGSVL